MFCDQCGSKLINDNDKFCPYCGAKRDVIAPTGNQPVPNNQGFDNAASYSNAGNEGYKEVEPVTVMESMKVAESVPVVESMKVVESVPVVEPMKVVESVPVVEPITVADPVYESEPVIAVDPIHTTETDVFETVQTTQSDPSPEIDVTKALDKEINKLQLEESQEPIAKIPDGFVLDSSSGWYYKSKGKQLATGAYVNEITWFDPKTAKTTVVDYPLSEQQVRAMLANQARSAQSTNTTQGQYQTQGQNPAQGQYQTQGQNPAQGQYQTQGQNPAQGQYQTQGQNPAQGQYQTQGQNPNQGQYYTQGQIPNQGQYQNQGQNQTQMVTEPKKKSKVGLIIGIVSAVVVLSLGFCTWKFEWYKIITGDKSKSVNNLEDPTDTPTPTATLTPTPTLTPVPENPLGTLNEDYIVVGGQEFETTAKTLYLDSMGLTNEDIEPLQYMKDLKFLYISENNITSLDAISGLTTLETLDASSNEIYDVVAISNLSNLTSLYLDHTQVSDLSPLTNLTNLSALGITYTQVFDLTPLVSLQSLMYLYVAEAPVDDFSPLSKMPNLYMCDVTNGTGDPANPTDPGSNNGGGDNVHFEFSEDDNLYFKPMTGNYLVASLMEDSTEQMFLFSYDAKGKCVQMRLRVDVGYELNESDVEDYLSYLEDTEEVSNVNFSGSVIYFDYPATDEEYSLTKDEIISQLKADNCQIIANENE